MPSVQNLSVLVHIELFIETLKILNYRALMKEYWLTDKDNKERKLGSFVKKLIYKYIILNCRVQIKECCVFYLMFRF